MNLLNHLAVFVPKLPSSGRELKAWSQEALAENGHHDSFYFNDLRISLANQVKPDMAPEEIEKLSVLDKQLAIMAEQKKLLEDIEFLRYEARDDAKRRRRDLSQRLFSAGAIFGT